MKVVKAIATDCVLEILSSSCLLQGQVPDNILDMSMAALQFGVTPESLVALLNGNISDSGVDVTPFKELGGTLSRLAEEERQLGSHVTEAIKVGCAVAPILHVEVFIILS